MDTNLFKVSNVCWAVTSTHSPEAQTFVTVEGACDYLESIKVPDEQIDRALIDMLAQGNTRANFGAINGEFIFSDNKRLNELLDVA
jgi:3-polyprenyl-4-hydroxybenzoate decarboxylase